MQIVANLPAQRFNPFLCTCAFMQRSTAADVGCVAGNEGADGAERANVEGGAK